MSVLTFYKKVFQYYLRRFNFAKGRSPMTPAEYNSIEREAVNWINKTKGQRLPGTPEPTKPPFSGWNPQVIQGGKGIESLIKSGDVKKGVAPKTTPETLKAKKDRGILLRDADEDIARIKRENKQAIKDFKEKNTPEVSGIDDILKSDFEVISGTSKKGKEIAEKLGITARPGFPIKESGKADLKVVKTKKRDRPSIRLIKNFERELTDIELAKEGYNLQEIGILKRARDVMKKEGQNPDDALAWVRSEMADDAGIEFDEFMTDFDWGDFPGKAEGGRIGMMYGGDPGFAFEYGGSWADWHDQHRDQMPVEQYIKTKLPKHRLPFREMQSGGIAQLSRPGYFFGGPAKGSKALKAIMDAWRANKHWGVGGPPYRPEKTSFNIKEMTKRNLGKELSLTDLRRLSESPLAGPQKGHFEDFNRQFKNIKASILREKMMEKKLEAKASINAAEQTMREATEEFNTMFGPLKDKKKQLDMSKRVTDQMTRESKESLKEIREGLKEIDIYMGMLQKKGRSVHQSGGLAYMLGEPTYMKYSVGGSVGHAPWHKPTGHKQPEAQQETPTPHVAGTPDPLKAPRGIPSVAPKNMDPAYMQQQMMQKAMMGRGQGMMGQGPRPMANEGGRIGFEEGHKVPEEFLEHLKRKNLHKLLEEHRRWKENYERRKDLGVTQEAAEGGRIGFKLGGIDKGRRAFMKWLAGIMGTGAAAGTGLLKLGTAAKVAKPAAAVTETIVKSNAAGMPAWFPSLVKRVIKEGEDVTQSAGAMERQMVHRAKTPEGTPIEVTQDLTTGDVIVDIGEQTKHGWSAGRHGQPVRLELKKGEWIEPNTTGGGFKTEGGKEVYPGMSKGARETEEVSGKGMKTKDEFWVQEAEFTGGHPENVKFEESVDFQYGDHGSDFSEIEQYATRQSSFSGESVGEVQRAQRREGWHGKKEQARQLEMDKRHGGLKSTYKKDPHVRGKQADRDAWAEGRAEAEWDDVEIDDYASGGLAHMLGE